MLADVIEAAEFESSHDESGCVGLQGDRQRARCTGRECAVKWYRYNRLEAAIILPV